MAKIRVELPKKKEESAVCGVVATQFIDIFSRNGATLTASLPNNREILETAQNTGKTPEFVARYLFFWSGVPPEYEWTNPITSSAPSVPSASSACATPNGSNTSKKREPPAASFRATSVSPAFFDS